MSSDIERSFEKAVRESGVVGAQLSISRGDRQIDLVHGLANSELRIPMTHDTLIQVGSTTKVFNATMILSLVEEGRVALDEPVKRYIPELELADHEATGAITLRHLLSMSAGIDNGDYADYGVGEEALRQRVAALKTLPQHFRPGTAFGYSNAGIDIAGYVAERVTGRLWDDLLRERVLDPAGLKNATSLDREHPFQRVSVGHWRDPITDAIQVIRPWGLSRGSGPAGSTLTISARDLVRFGKLFLNAGVAESGVSVLSEDSVRTLMRPHVAVPAHFYARSWCLGPCMTEWEGMALWGHPGGNVSGMSYLYWIPDKQAVVAWIANTPCCMAQFNRVIMQETLRAALQLGKPSIEAPASTIGIDPSRYVGVYEALGGRCEVQGGSPGKLILRKTWKEFTNEALETTETLFLIPLGNDRFLIDRGAGSDPMGLAEDLAFFGDDGEGHASNMLVGLFPCSRNKHAT